MFGIVVGATVALTALVANTDIWWRYPFAVGEFINRPSGSVTAYQTTVSLFRRLCIADPQWNPSAPASCAPLAVVMPSLILAAAMLTTMVLARRAPARLWVAAAICLCELSLPAAAEPHSVLFTIPLALLALTPTTLALFGALYLVPLDYSAHVFTDGWSVLAAYPRLYALWLLWGLAVVAMVRRGQPLSEACPDERGARRDAGSIRA
jgi:hypothetical protein